MLFLLCQYIHLVHIVYCRLFIELRSHFLFIFVSHEIKKNFSKQTKKKNRSHCLYLHFIINTLSGTMVKKKENANKTTIVGILTFISMINATYESLKARKSLILSILFYEQLKFNAHLS